MWGSIRERTRIAPDKQQVRAPIFILFSLQFHELSLMIPIRKTTAPTARKAPEITTTIPNILVGMATSHLITNSIIQ